MSESTAPNELILTESRTLRAQTVDRTDVLNKVKALTLLPNDMHATVEIVSSYFDTTIDAIEKVVQRNRQELADNGYVVLRGADYRTFAADNLSAANPKSRSVALFTRRTILNIGQLLTESDVARRVRTYLLEIEESATPEQRGVAVEQIALAEARMRVLKAADGIVDPTWLETKARVLAARVLGEEPDVDPLDVPLYVPDFLRDKGLNRRQIESVQSWFGRRAADICQVETGERPGKRQSDLPNGSVRETHAWTERHRPIFEKTWDRYYEGRFPIQGSFGGAA
jgi:hypothetical protein